GCSVRVIVPPAVSGDTSTGLDDALAAGHKLQEMVGESIDDLPKPRPGRVRRSSVMATLPEDEKPDPEAVAKAFDKESAAAPLDGEIVEFPDDESPDSIGFTGGPGKVIDMTLTAVGDLTGTPEGRDQLAAAIGLPSMEVIRLAGKSAWRAVYTAKNIARGLASLLSDHFRFVTDAGSWRRYDGQRWVPTLSSDVRQVVEGITQAERDAALSSEDDVREACSTALLGSRFDSSVVSSLEPRLGVKMEDFDADRDVLNVWNGVLDLRTGDLRPSRPGDLMTKLADVDYRTLDSYSEAEAAA